MLSYNAFGHSGLYILGKFLKVIELGPLGVHSPVYEHGLMPVTQPFPDKSCCPLLICGATLEIKEGLNLGVDLGQSPQRILVGIPQLPVNRGLRNHCAQVFGNVPFIAERAVSTAEHIAGELEGHLVVHAEQRLSQHHPAQPKSTFQE